MMIVPAETDFGGSLTRPLRSLAERLTTQTTRRSALFLALSLVGVSALASPGLAGAAQAGSSGATSLVGSPLVIPGMQALDRGQQLRNAQAAQLSSSSAFQAREVSQAAYQGLDDGRARGHAAAAFPELINKPAGGPPQLPAGQRITGYPTDSSAQVDLGGGRRAVIDSSAPLALMGSSGRRTPIDLGLQSSGDGFAPKAPAVGVRIPKRLGDGPSLPALGISLTPLDTHSTPAGVIDGATAFYANTGVDADTVVKPVVRGLEVDALLRSARSSEQLSYRVGLPAGARLEQDQKRLGSVQIVEAGKVIATVLAPSAQDAAGTQVPVSLAVSGDTLTVSVSHRSGQYEYPIYVDPTIIDTKKSLFSTGNWEFLTNAPPGIICAEEEADTEAKKGLLGIIKCPEGPAYSREQFGFLQYVTQGESKIFEYRAETFTFPTSPTGPIVAYISMAQPPAYEAGPLLISESLAQEWHSVAAAGKAGNIATYEVIVTALSGTEKFESYMRGAEVKISQEKGPQVTMDTTHEVVGGRQNALYGGRWSSTATGSWGFAATGSDPGTGLNTETWSSPSAPKWGSTRALSCGGVQCETLWTLTNALKGEGTEQLPEGEDTVEAQVKDPVGFTAGTGLFKVKVDNAAPHAITLTGLPASHELDDGQRFTLTAGATDGTSPTVSSGIASVVLMMDGQQFGGSAKSCTPGPCTSSGEWTLAGNDFAAGQHILAVVATDNAGNVAAEEFKLTFHHATPIAVGPGTVSPTTGELNLSANDVSIAAAGLKLTVARSYRSRHLTGGSGGPLGPQWGLSVGAQQSLSRALNGSVVLSDSSGRQTVFTANGKGNFTSPPGDSGLTLKEKVVGNKITFQLSQSGAVTTFAVPSGGSGGLWVPSVSEGAGGTGTVTFAYKTEAGITEPTQELAPVPTGVSCSPTLNKGCRALAFTYAKATTASGEGFSQWGEFTGRLKEVSFTAWDPASKAMATKVDAQYSYDKQGRLRAVWNPQVTPILKATYGYDAEGHVTASTSAGVQPWLFEQGTVPSDAAAGRILAIARPAATTVAEQKAEVEASAPANTVVPTLSSSTPVVGVKISVAGNGTWSNSPLAYRYQWNDCNSAGKECVPINGAVNQSYYPVAADEGHTLSATVTAFNAGGAVSVSSAATGLVAKGTPSTPLPEPPSVGTLSVLTIEYQVPLSGTGVPQVTSTDVAKWGQTDLPVEAAAVFPPDEPMGWPAKEYKHASLYYLDSRDRSVNVASPLGAISTSEYNTYNDVVRTLSPANRATALAAGESSVKLAKELDSENTYNETGSEPGTELLIALGPKHPIQLTDGTKTEGRKRTFYSHNLGAPAEGGPYHLVTQMTEGAMVGASEEPASTRSTKTTYSSQNNLGWKLRKPSAVTIDSPGLALTHSIYYDPKSGNITETRLPAAGAPTPEQGDVFKFQFGKVGIENLQFKEPQDIVVTATGNEYVLDSGNARISQFNAKGEWVRKFGSLGSEPGQLKNPSGMAIDAKGNVWVSDTGNNRVQEFSATGGLLATLVGAFSAPQGMAFDSEGYMWLVDSSAGQLKKYFYVETGKIFALAQTVGTKGTGNLQFTEPQGIAIGAEGNLYVSDAGNNRIEELSSAGAFIRVFGKEGTATGQLKKAHDVATDASGNVWVADTGNNRIQEFGPTGTFTQAFGVEGTKEGALLGPKGVAIDAEANVWVADTANSRVQEWLPNGTGYGLGTASPHNSQSVVYTAGPNSKVAACGEHPEWVNLPCQDQPAANIEGALPKLKTTIYTYNYWDELETAVDTSGTTTRTTTITYDSAGRQKTLGTTSSAGTALSTITDKYNETLGSPEGQSTTTEGVTKTITTNYNTLGQPTSYVDADGSTSTYEYDIDGRVKKTNDGKGTQTLTYSEATGQLTEVTDSSAAGMKFAPVFDIEGKLLNEAYPNGMKAVYSYDTTGKPTGLEFIKTTHCTEKCTWFKETVLSSIHGQVMSHESSLSAQQYTYDAMGRLTQVKTTPAGKGCTTRLYTYDADTNRTGMTTRAPEAKGECAKEGGTLESHTYDTADRLIDAGISYGAFGDITALSAADAGGSTLTSNYFVNNQVQSQTQNGQTIGYSLDPARRTREILNTGKVTSTVINHFSGPSNAPAWTVNTSAEWTRNIPDISGHLAAVQSNGEAPVLQLSNLHGDVIATAPLSETATGLASSVDTTEYGVPTTSLPPKYGWLGAVQVPTELPSGVMAMGPRSYVPQLGRFLQPDPVAGGSANTYGYNFGDPVNSSDAGGTSSMFDLVASHAAGVAAAARLKEEEEIRARKAAEEAAARAMAGSGAEEAVSGASWAAGSQYLEGEEWEEFEEEEGEEEEGEWEFASYGEADGVSAESHSQDAVLFKPLPEPTETQELDVAVSNGVVQACPLAPSSEPCVRNVSILKRAKNLLKKTYHGGKWFVKREEKFPKYVYHLLTKSFHAPTLNNFLCAPTNQLLDPMVAFYFPEYDVAAKIFSGGREVYCQGLELQGE